MENKPLFKKTDMIIILICIIAAGIFMLPKLKKSDSVTAVITVSGEEFTEIDLSSLTDIKEFNVNGVNIKAENGSICVTGSDCRDKLCAKTGKLSKSGDSTACIPNGVAIYITGSDGNDIDAVAY